MLTVTDTTGTISIQSATDIIQSPDKVKVAVRAFGTTVQIWWSETNYVSDDYTNYTIGGVVYGTAFLAAAAIAAMLNTTGGGGNTQNVTYTIGLAGVAGCDYNFTAPTNTTKQSIQLGSNIIPANSPVTSIVAKCKDGVTGGTAVADIGKSSGSDEYISQVSLSATDDIASISAQVVASASATAIWFSITPDANWSTLSDGKWAVSINYNNNSSL